MTDHSHDQKPREVLTLCRKCGTRVWALEGDDDPVCVSHFRLRDFGPLLWLAVVSIFIVGFVYVVARLLGG